MDIASFLGLKHVKQSAPRIEEHFPVVFASIDHVVWILAAYVLFIAMGPRVMFRRRPLKLACVMSLYNIFQVVANLYLAQWAVRHFNEAYGVFGVWNNICHPIGRYVRRATRIDLVRLMMFYYFNKILDLFDTVFLILMKKRSRLRFLHVFHHSTMVFSSWITIAYCREYICLIFGLINMIVHCFMYSYYLFSLYCSSMQKYFFWKQLLTNMQLVQFVAMVVLLLKMNIDNCKYDVIFWRLWIFNFLSFTALFLNLYKTVYNERRNRR